MTGSLNVLIIGAGSIGTRHAKVLASLPGVTSALVPLRAERVPEIRGAGLDSMSLAEARECRPDAVVIATDTNRHVEDARPWLERGAWALIEKPLAVDCPSTDPLLPFRNIRIACCLRAYEALHWVRERLPRIGRLHSARIVCQSYLPDWRPTRDYRASYSADVDQGGVLRDLVHEVDYGYWLFGRPRSLFASFQPGDALGIRSEAGVDMVWTYAAGLAVSFRLDYLTRHPRRSLSVEGDGGGIELDLLTGTGRLRTRDGQEEVLGLENPFGNMYHSQMQGFLALVRGGTDPNALPDLDQGREVMVLLDRARESATRGERVPAAAGCADPSGTDRRPGEVQLFEVADRSGWREALAPFADVDIYSDPGYIAQAAGDDRACLVKVVAGRGRLAMPVVFRPVPPALGIQGVQDAESPYGYPGIHAEGPREDLEACWSMAKAHLKSLGVANLFLRLHPFLPFPPLGVDFRGAPHATVYIPLAEGREAAFQGSACTTHRSQVNRARRMGFSAQILERPSKEDFQAFREMYEETMDRLAAGAEYRFPLDYYLGLGDELGTGLVIIRALGPDGQVLCQALFMAGRRFAHYHLSCRAENAHNVASHLIFEAAADWAYGRGLERIHLGGGTTEDPSDPLLGFKCRIGRGRSSFQVVGLRVDPEAHETLMSAWRRQGGDQPRWFQAYRQPVTRKPTAEIG